ncbi:MAG: ribbon-helix-helix domain-containing protein [Bacillota bacterium]
MVKEKVTVALPPETAKKLRELAAERRVPVSALVALAIERFVADLEFSAQARRLETLLRAVLYGVGELVDPDNGREAARRLVNQAAARRKGGGAR